MKSKRQNITNALSLGVILMGMIHVIATFTPIIADKLALLPDGTHDAFTYFSLMCGALLILAGGMIYTLSEKVAKHPFVRKPYLLALAILVVDGVLAVYYMHHNPFAWIIFVLTIGLLLTNVTRLRKNTSK